MKGVTPGKRVAEFATYRPGAQERAITRSGSRPGARCVWAFEMSIRTGTKGSLGTLIGSQRARAPDMSSSRSWQQCSAQRPLRANDQDARTHSRGVAVLLVQIAVRVWCVRPLRADDDVCGAVLASYLCAHRDSAIRGHPIRSVEADATATGRRVRSVGSDAVPSSGRQHSIRMPPPDTDADVANPC